MVDSVEESLQASRRFLLLYNASTFRHTSNNNNNSIVLPEDSGGSTSLVYDEDGGGGGEYPDQRQQFEVVAGMHRALLEGSLKVRKPTSSRQLCVLLMRGEISADACSFENSGGD